MLLRLLLPFLFFLNPLRLAAVEVPPFTDVPEGIWYAFYVSEAARLGVVSGYKTPEGQLTGSYGPEDPVTVVEILKMSLEAAKVNELECQGTAQHQQAHDHWAYPYVVCAEERRFRLFSTFPDLNRPALRSEVLAIMHDAFGEIVPEATTSFSDARGNAFESDIAYAAARGVVSGDTDERGTPTGKFRPNDGVNRAEAAKIVYEQLRALQEEGIGDSETGLFGFQPQESADLGDFYLVYDTVSTARYEEYEQAFKESGLFEVAVNELNNAFALPLDVSVVLGECGVPNALYLPEDEMIVLCYELVDEIATDFAGLVETEEELDLGIIHTLLFIFYHELGHALIDIYALPITGREEDAVDQLSAMILIEAGGEAAVLDGAAWFLMRAGRTNLNESAFADEHGLDTQRFYNLSCWVYGKDPRTHSYIVEDGNLTAERAVRCEEEYSRMSSSWDRLLAPHLKGDAAAPAVTPQQKSFPPALSPPTVSSCTIKGNISSSGERIYHLPGCRSYEKTQIDPSAGEHWFCSEQEAVAAGWRKAGNCP